MNIQSHVIKKEELLKHLGVKPTDYVQVVKNGDEFEFQILSQEDYQLIVNLFDVEKQKQIEEVISKLYMLGLIWNDEEYSLDDLITSWNQTTNEDAVTMIQLLDAFYKAYAVLKLDGLSIEDMSVLTAHMASRTRESGNIIGNALKSILARMKNNDVIEGLNARNLNITDGDNGVNVLDKIKKYLSSIVDKEERSKELSNIAKLIGGNYHIVRATTIIDRV